MRGRRRSVRRAVALDCALQSELWDGVVHLPASNLSTDGIWIETPIALEPGEELVVSFTPPGGSEKVWAAARVVRSTRARRRGDPAAVPGMGLAFTYCSDAHHRLLARALLGQPPRLPHERVPPPLPTAEQSVRSANTIKISDPTATIQISDDEVYEDAPIPSASATIQVSDDEIEGVSDDEPLDPSRVVRLPTCADETVEG